MILPRNALLISPLAMLLALSQPLWARDLEPLTDSDDMYFAGEREKSRQSEEEDKDEPGFVVRGLQQMEIQRDWLSKGYVGMWRGLDSYFTDGANFESENDSEMRLETKQSWRA